jgi:hypothetical protein
MATTKITDTMARLDDAAELNAALAPLRDSRRVQEKLLLGFRGHQYFYDRRTRTARYLYTDGTIVICYSITDVSLAQASVIAVHCEALTVRSMAAFRTAVERALGVRFDRLH